MAINSAAEGTEKNTLAGRPCNIDGTIGVLLTGSPRTSRSVSAATCTERALRVGWGELCSTTWQVREFTFHVKRPPPPRVAHTSPNVRRCSEPPLATVLRPDGRRRQRATRLLFSHHVSGWRFHGQEVHHTATVRACMALQRQNIQRFRYIKQQDAIPQGQR